MCNGEFGIEIIKRIAGEGRYLDLGTSGSGSRVCVDVVGIGSNIQRG